MKSRYLKLFLTLIFVLTGLNRQTVFAESSSEIQIESVRVEIWPEFTRSAALILNEISLSSDTLLPQDIIIKIPVDAAVQTVADQGENRLTPLTWESVPERDWQEIRFRAANPIIYIEYFAPVVDLDGDLRTFTYDWHSPYPVPSLEVVVLLSSESGEVMTEPSLVPVAGVNSEPAAYQGTFGPVSGGEMFSLHLEYVGESDHTTYPALRVLPAVPVDESTYGRMASPLSVIVWLMGAAAAIIFLVGLCYWWFRNSQADERTRAAKGVGILNLEKQAAFCHECGTRSRAGDRYCRNCGTGLRKIP